MEGGQGGQGGPAAAGIDVDRLTDAVWLLAAIAVFLDPDGKGQRHDGQEDDGQEEASQLLLAHGLLLGSDAGAPVPTPEFSALVDGREDAFRNAIRSVLSQAAGIAAHGLGARWQGQDAETLLAQGRASAMSGRLLATAVVPRLDGLAARFAAGGVLLDVGVGIAGMASAFCLELPAARVIGLDPFPLALELAHKTIHEHGVADRVELRAHGVERLTADEEIDLAWLPTPFIPRPAVEDGIARIFRALRPGGWLVLPGATVEPGVRGATAKFQVAAAGGSAFTASERAALLAGAGFGAPIRLDVPPGAPEMWAARRPE